MTVQSVSSVIRQVLGVVATAFGIITASVSSLHLPPAVSAILTAAGPIILAIEHYVSDPSTGTTNAPPPVAVVAPTAVPTTPVTTPGSVA